MIDKTYWNNCVYIAFHHTLCDGRDIMPFLETLIYHYCGLRYNKKSDPSGIRLAGEALLLGETQEPIESSIFDVNEDSLSKMIEDGYSLPENSENCSDFYRYELQLSKQDFLNYMRSNKAKPAILLVSLVSEIIYSVHFDADKPIVCSMAMDYRKEIGLDNTHKNCVGSLYLPYSEETDKMSISERATFYRSLIK